MINPDETLVQVKISETKTMKLGDQVVLKSYSAGYPATTYHVYGILIGITKHSVMIRNDHRGDIKIGLVKFRALNKE